MSALASVDPIIRHAFAANILKLTHRLQMIWIDAKFDATEVIYDMIRRNLPHQKLIRESMGQRTEAAIVSGYVVTITICTHGPSPQPAESTGLNLGPEAILQSLQTIPSKRKGIRTSRPDRIGK